MSASVTPGRPGDRLEVFSHGGAPPRRGEIIEVLGQPHHEHYRVRWDDGRESIHYPSEGTKLVAARRPGHHGATG
jgi:hypothetical protein